MGANEATLSRNGAGKVKLEYAHDGQKRTVLWEPLGSGTVETIFDGEGAIALQRIFSDKIDKEAQVARFIKAEKIAGVRQGDYSEIRFNKKCPTCGADSLQRLAETISDSSKMPVMPIYVCGSCKGKSYYLTDSYLEHLISNNVDLFEENERKALDSDKGAFVKEIKEYIIRIFASKRIMCIK